jgi:endoglucanase
MCNMAIAQSRLLSAIALPLILSGSCGSDTQPSSAGSAAAENAIKLDQVGYLPNAPKLAMVTEAGATGGFRVRRASDGADVFSGTLGGSVHDPDSGDTVRLADFSALTQTGTFELDVAGVGRSHPFEISPGVYAEAFYLAARAFYGQRCGTAVDLAPTHPGYAHPACHVAGTPNPDAQMHSSSGARGSRDGRRGWHDAGDYGKYVVNSGIATAELLWAYELYAGRVGAVRLDIPESGNDVPDLLDEVRWNLEWMLTMQDQDGGVWHKLTSERFGGFVMPHLDDGGPRYVIGTGTAPFKSSCATADFAAVMAIAARVYLPFDASFGRTALAAAEAAWGWLARFPNVTFRNCCGVETGEYGDGNCADERLWAAAELHRTTGSAAYGAAFVAGQAAFQPAIDAGAPQAWPSLRNLAMLTYYLSARPGSDEGVRGRIRADLLAAADAIAARTGGHAYRISLQPDEYVWGSNGVAANYGVLLMIASAIQGDERHAAAALENLHYLLGRNAFGLSWVTGLGDRPFERPHHRPSGADANARPWPGMLAGGPNRYGGDPVIDALPATPPARRYRDDQASYASNEIAINWNAPLVFVLAATLPEPTR